MKPIRLPSAFLYGAFVLVLFASVFAGMPQLFSIAGYAIVALMLLASIATGDAILTLFGMDEQAPERDCFAIAVGLQPLWGLPLLLGWLGMLRPTTLLGCLLALAIAGVPAARRVLPRLLKSACPQNWRSPFSILLVVILLIYFAHTLLPAVFFDALHYHLSVPAQDLLAGKLLFTPYTHGANYPMGAEFLALYGLAAGDDGALKKINFGLLLLLLIFIGRALGRGRGGTIAQLITASSPLIGYAATIEFIDLQLTLYLVLFVHAMLVSSEDENTSPFLLSAAAFAGAALAVKYIAIPYLAITMLYWLWRRRSSLRGSLRPIAIALVISILVPLPWYARSYFQTGNPVFPYFNSVFRSPFAPEKPLSSQDDMHGYRTNAERFSPLSLLRYPIEVSTQGSRGGMLSDPGILFIALLPLVIVKRPSGRRERDSLLLCLAFFLAWWFLSGYLIRYVCLIFPFLAASAGRAVDELLGERIALRKLATAGIGLGLFVNMSTYLGQMNLFFKSPSYLVGGLSREELLNGTITYYPAACFINGALPANARVLLVGERRSYYIRRECVNFNFFVENPLIAAMRNSLDPESTRRRLLQQGITHLLVNQKHLQEIAVSNPVYIPPEALPAIAGFCSSLRQLYSDSRYAVYAIGEDAPETPPK